MQKCRGRQQERDAILADQRADGPRFERAGMVHDSHSNGGGQTQRPGKTERMKERQNPENLVVASEHEDLIQLLDVGGDVVVREYDALRITGTAAGEDNGGDVVEACLAGRSHRLLDESHRQQPGNECGHQPFHRSRIRGKILQHDGLRRHLEMHTLQKSLRRDHGL